MAVGVNDTVCIIDSTLPAYQPNIYICKNNTICCSLNGRIKCCATDVTFHEFFNQALPFILLLIVLLLIPLVLSWIFGDQDFETFMKEEENQEHDKNLHEATPDDIGYNDEDEDGYSKIVEDPVFGTLYHTETSDYYKNKQNYD